ncbi:MAG: hypothetical protein R2824_23180 [Saprospiraceae bacterium]
MSTAAFLLDGALELLQQLQSRYRLALVTNWPQEYSDHDWKRTLPLGAIRRLTIGHANSAPAVFWNAQEISAPDKDPGIDHR